MRFPARGLFDSSTGLMESRIGRDWYRGSGVVARDPKLIYSCGHLFYDYGLWATDYVFYRAYDSRTGPDPSEGASPRGFRYFTSYSQNADIYGPDSPRAFASDFTVFYGPQSFGPAVGWWEEGASILRSDRLKRIVGYPTGIEYTGAPGYYYQHGTDWFSTPARQTQGVYFTLNNVSTGGGNSGGPVFAWDEVANDYSLAGILVAGTYTSAGVYALNSSSNSMASSALGLPSTTRVFRNTKSVRLPDATGKTVIRSTTASGFSETISKLKFGVSISTPRRGDLNVYLRSPTGRIRWINKRSASSANHLKIDQADYTSNFRGLAANGVWQLRMRDAVAGNRAIFNHFSLAISAIEE